MFPQLPVQPSTECVCTDTLNSNSILFFDRSCHNKQSQTKQHHSIKHHILHRKPIPPYIFLLSTCALNPSLHYLPVINFSEEGGWRPSFPGEDDNYDKNYKDDCGDGAITIPKIFRGYKLDDDYREYCYYPLAEKSTAPAFPL